ncbi:hypothetical protein [Breoghania sp. L-A4]|uniref:hypothetical protein n=1 Tax=Breoghania sp. L-A4 TaxID=2304600 RepID=UPI000E359EAC|nr:hypothetical protein [Breoghania sp. L-A4]AXS39751.1 hypothetical protein D1F64_06410 [Breoghania sp. L-A4]
MFAFEKTLRRTVAFAALIATLAAGPAAAEGLEGLTPNSAAAGIYGTDHLAGMADTAHLVYDYDLAGAIMPKPFHDEVVLDFARKEKAEERTYDVTVSMFTQTRNQSVGPITSTSVNPLVMVFLQRDVNQMGRSTGGSSHYFRNVIRRAMAAAGHHTETPVSIDWQGKTLEATRISFQPFISDKNKARMESFAAKTYSFTLAPGVPGGVYEVGSSTAEPGGDKVLLRETYRLRESTQ